MNSNNFSKGDILEATHRELTKGRHYIVFFEGYNSKDDFCGCMLTHSNDFNNIPMLSNHFIINNFEGKPFKVQYENSYLVKGKFLKSEGWGPFKKVGSYQIQVLHF